MANMCSSPSTSSQNSRAPSTYVAARPIILSTAKLFLFGVLNLPFLRAAPTNWVPTDAFILEDEGMPANSSTLWIYLAVALGLVLLGGAFAGLTIALMGQVRPVKTILLGKPNN